eukprot:5628475-Alexandrium_andersonii.AAC.1
MATRTEPGRSPRCAPIQTTADPEVVLRQAMGVTDYHRPAGHRRELPCARPGVASHDVQRVVD